MGNVPTSFRVFKISMMPAMSTSGAGSQDHGGRRLSMSEYRICAEGACTLTCDSVAGLKETKALKHTGPRVCSESASGKWSPSGLLLGLVGCRALTKRLWNDRFSATVETSYINGRSDRPPSEKYPCIVWPYPLVFLQECFYHDVHLEVTWTGTLHLFMRCSILGLLTWIPKWFEPATLETLPMTEANVFDATSPAWLYTCPPNAALLLYNCIFPRAESFGIGRSQPGTQGAL